MRLISLYNHLFLTVLFFIAHSSNAQVQGTRSAIIEDMVSIAGLKGGNISKSILLSADSLTIQGDSISNSSILSYKLTVVYESGSDPVEFESRNGGKLTDAMRSAIQKAYKGCNVFVEFIKGRSSDGTVHSHSPLSFKIVD